MLVTCDMDVNAVHIKQLAQQSFWQVKEASPSAPVVWLI